MYLFLQRMLFVAAMCMPFQPLLAIQHSSFLSSGNYDELSAHLYSFKQDSCLQGIPSIIGGNEWDELQLDWLLKKLDKTETSLGRWALRNMLHPIADEEAIKERQALVRALVEDPELYKAVKECLISIQKAETIELATIEYLDELTGIKTKIPVVGGLLAYWDQSQFKESEKLFSKIESLYFTSPILAGKQYLNNSVPILEGSMAIESVRQSLNLLYEIGLYGVSEEIGMWVLDDTHGPLDLVKGFKNGLQGPLRDMNPFPSQISENYDPNTYGSFKKAFLEGTAGDRFVAIKKNYNSRSEVKMWVVGRMLHKLPWIGNSFKSDGTYILENKANPYENPDMPNSKNPGLFRRLTTNAFAGSVTTIISYWRLMLLYDMFRHTCKYLTVLFNALHHLQKHLVHISHAMHAIQKLTTVINAHDTLHSSCIADHLNSSFGKSSSKQLKKLLTLLDSVTFNEKRSLFYSRGRTLLAHKLLKDTRDELLPVLRGVAELDAVYAMATNVLEHQESTTPFSFVEFKEGAEASIAFEDCWVPVLDAAIANSLYFGNGHPTKLVITGPNGGGKSTILKALGQCVVLAQSWGIVPARKSEMTIFNALRTCLHPNESLKDGLSTFMAEKARVDDIQSFVQQHRSPHHKVMLLLDEPFKGTVDRESAERIYAFGKNIAPLPQSIVCIATHVQKPVLLAHDTDGAFTNCHVLISENQDDSFAREFRLVEGPARWWFEDAAKRSRFIDWLGQETIRMKYAQISDTAN